MSQAKNGFLIKETVFKKLTHLGELKQAYVLR